jgi:hypothetical protein
MDFYREIQRIIKRIHNIDKDVEDLVAYKEEAEVLALTAGLTIKQVTTTEISSLNAAVFGLVVFVSDGVSKGIWEFVDGMYRPTSGNILYDGVGGRYKLGINSEGALQTTKL